MLPETPDSHSAAGACGLTVRHSTGESPLSLTSDRSPLCGNRSPVRAQTLPVLPVLESSGPSTGPRTWGFRNKPLSDAGQPPSQQHPVGPPAPRSGLRLHLQSPASSCMLSVFCGVPFRGARPPTPPLTATSTDCMDRSHGGFRALGLVAYQKVVSAAKAPKPMSVLVGSVRTYCRKSASSGMRKYRNSSWACMVLCWCRPRPASVGREKRHVHSGEAGLFPGVPQGLPPRSGRGSEPTGSRAGPLLALRAPFCKNHFRDSFYCDHCLVQSFH